MNIDFLLGFTDCYLAMVNVVTFFFNARTLGIISCLAFYSAILYIFYMIIKSIVFMVFWVISKLIGAKK